jgi:hypothetical protein
MRSAVFARGSSVVVAVLVCSASQGTRPAELAGARTPARTAMGMVPTASDEGVEAQASDHQTGNCGAQDATPDVCRFDLILRVLARKIQMSLLSGLRIPDGSLLSKNKFVDCP